MSHTLKKVLAFLCLFIAMPLSFAQDAAQEKEMWDARTGKTLADISGIHYTPEGNISARAGYTGQCTWYAYGRFYEVTGIALDTALHAKFWLSMNDQDERLTVLYGKNKICYPAVSVSTSGSYGHVMFIEYVSMKNGQPDMVYFTQCNRDNNGRYDEGKDAILQRLPFDLFIKYQTPAGYITAGSKPS